jgi:L-asparagine transporter-like permease
MLHNEKNISVRQNIILLLVFLNAVILKVAFTRNESWYFGLIVTFPLLLVAIYNMHQRKHVKQQGSKLNFQ